jgi:ribosomal protein S27AE
MPNHVAQRKGQGRKALGTPLEPRCAKLTAMAEHTNDDKVEELRAEILHLRAQLANLDQDVRRAQQHIDLTMRGQLRCRACNCRRIAHAPQVLDRAAGGNGETMVLYAPGWFDDGTTFGHFEAYVCTACGLVEWWVKDPAALEPLKDKLLILGGEPADAKGPYR